MKVAFYVRGNSNHIKGGDLIQMYSTAKALEKLGVTISYVTDPKKNLHDFDIVHIFNSPRFNETKSYFVNAQKQSKPIAFSTIYWSKKELEVGSSMNLLVRVCRFLLGLKITSRLFYLLKSKDKKGMLSTEKWLFKEANILLPNSTNEMKEIEKEFEITNQYQVVRNAIDVENFRNVPSTRREDYVLCVGRIDRRKNTIKLIKACRKLGYHLVLIGDAPSEDIYAKDCMDLITRYQFEYLPNVPPAKLGKYYYGARVHAMVSWYETPGLSSLEAACGGCSIVSTDRGSTKEYFQDEVEYCDPFSQKSIETAIIRAWSKPPSVVLRDKILRTYTWDKAAQDTLDGYKQIINLA